MKYLLVMALAFFVSGALAQILDGKKERFTEQDTLRGSITPERAWWDLNYYHLKVKVDMEERTFTGSTNVHYTVLSPYQSLQIDLQEPLKISKVVQNGKKLKFEKNGNAYFIDIKAEQVKGEQNSLEVFYEGKPRKAVRAPWDGGISWTTDDNGKQFVATSCQGLGASVWWPCKDHMYDEPDSMLMSINVPDPYIDVSNGRLRQAEKHKNGTTTYHWYVDNPINNYGVNLNIGDYVNWSEVYPGEKGDLDIDYYVLRNNEEKAKEHFDQVPQMLKAFEYWFGPYPFYDDSFKLVEAPYLGMEHQSSITYGNKYQNGYLGTDLSGSGWGLKFDYLIIHESGHEWFANNITYKDIADMWVHEGFTTYSECLFVEHEWGKEAGAEYVIGIRKNIQNDRPIIGTYDVNSEGSSDMYPKSANVLHMIRQMVNDDERWRNMLRKMNEVYYHKTITTEEIERFMSIELDLNLDKVFDQYLRTKDIPVLEYYIQNGQIFHRWMNTVSRFKMAIEIKVGDEELKITPKNFWGKTRVLDGSGNVEVDKDYYIL